MAEYIVVGFPGQFTASKVVKSLQDAGIMELNVEAAAVIARDDIGRVLVRTEDDVMEESTKAGAVAGGVAGLLIGAITLNPIAGLLAGTAVGGISGLISGKVNDIGIDDDYTREVGRLMDMDSSAICFLFWDQPWDHVPGPGKQIIQDAGGKVIRTTLSVENEQELKEKLGIH